MEKSWNMKDWNPTCPSGGWEKPPPHYAIQKSKVAKNLTTRIIDAPYDPYNWFLRGANMMELGFPELAVGDAYKATLLADAGLDYASDLGERVRLQFGMSIWLRNMGSFQEHVPAQLFRMRVTKCITEAKVEAYKTIVTALSFLKAGWENLQFCQKARKEFPKESLFQVGEEHSREFLKVEWARMEEETNMSARVRSYELRLGVVKVRAYPWIPKQYLCRNDKLIESVNEEFTAGGFSCTIAKSTFQKTATHPVFGVFATKSFRKGELIFSDATPTGVTTKHDLKTCANCCRDLTSLVYTSDCCTEVAFCTPSCRAIALKYYHRILCDKDFSWLYDATKSDARHCRDARDLLFVRFLAMCVQSEGHPLDLPIIARLTPAYHTEQICTWAMNGNIIEPIKILQQLGVDVFANLQYDTWVLQTLWVRIKNNNRVKDERDPSIWMVNSFYSFLNHHCDPNTIETEFERSSTTVQVARRAIKKDEEVFTSYLGDQVEGMSRKERRRQLFPWLGGDCECGKCRTGS